MSKRPEKLRLPPSSITGEMGQWCMELWRVINRTPTMSYFSATTPNSAVTGFSGDLAMNVASGSTDTRLWIMGGNSLSASTNKGWVTLHTGPA